MQVTRRRLMKTATAAITTRTFAGGVQARQAPNANSAAVVRGKHDGLIVHTTDPVQMETPIALLRQHKVTPTELIFIRNNLELENSRTLAPLPLAGWPVEFGGLVEYPRVVDAAQLLNFPKIERLMVLQCSGNGRAFFSKVAKVKGEPWTRGALANVRFAGASLATVLESLKLNVDRVARFITAEGRDAPKSVKDADFEHSLPLDDCLERGMLAYELNGKPIPAVHGGPVRLIVPGYYGTMQMKWLSRLRFESHETSNHHQLSRYRTPIRPIAPGSAFVNTFENSEPNWRLKTKCVIFSPLDSEPQQVGNVAVSGVAFSDGTPIETVLISTDRGLNWRRAELSTSADAFAWREWKTQMPLRPGRNEILARAIDAAGRSQPLDPGFGWNPAGYAYYSTDRVTIDVR